MANRRAKAEYARGPSAGSTMVARHEAFQSAAEPASVAEVAEVAVLAEVVVVAAALAVVADHMGIGNAAHCITKVHSRVEAERTP
jgi:hypothetical protein